MEIEGPPTGLRELIDGPMPALQDLFVVMVGEPVVITELFVRPNDPGLSICRKPTFIRGNRNRHSALARRVSATGTAERWSCSMIPGPASPISYQLGSISTSLWAMGSNCCVCPDVCTVNVHR
jgi:hypothetical protein